MELSWEEPLTLNRSTQMAPRWQKLRLLVLNLGSAFARFFDPMGASWCPSCTTPLPRWCLDVVVPILLPRTEKKDGVCESEIWKVKNATAWDSMSSKGLSAFEERLWHLLKLSWTLLYSNLVLDNGSAWCSWWSRRKFFSNTYEALLKSTVASCWVLETCLRSVSPSEVCLFRWWW